MEREDLIWIRSCKWGVFHKDEGGRGKLVKIHSFVEVALEKAEK
jgi:hypothetical protein